jgi:dihydrofolate reductase
MKIIVATTKTGGIGFKGKIPWNSKQDMIHFKKMTNYQTVVMGRCTWESINEKPLPNRVNIVMTTKSSSNTSCHHLSSFKDIHDSDTTWIIGGENLYKEALASGLVTDIYKTVVDGEFECDRFFPKIPNEYIQKSTTKTQGLEFQHFSLNES